MTYVKIEFQWEMDLARRISGNGFGRIEETDKGHRLVIFPEYAIMEKLFQV
jgi:hypothetical protein